MGGILSSTQSPKYITGVEKVDAVDVVGQGQSQGEGGQDKDKDQEGEGAPLHSRKENKLMAIPTITMDRNGVIAKFMLTATIVQRAKRECSKDFEARLEPLQLRLVKYLPKDPGPEVVLCNQNRVDVQTLLNNLHKRQDGKFLLCRTITEAVNGVWLEAVVEDPSGKNVAILRLKNFTPSKYSLAVSDTGKDWLPWLPTGSYIAVKNTFASVVGRREKEMPVIIWNDNPAEVVLLSPKRMKELFPELVWKGSEVSFWDNAGNTDSDVIETLRKTGNTAFVLERYTDALRWYELALDYGCVGDNVGLVNIWSNKAAAFLGLGCYREALEFCDQVLLLDPNHVKAIFRKVKALIGLGRNIEAKTFINDKLSLVDSDDLRVLSGKIPKVTSKTRMTHSQDNMLQATEKDLCPELVGAIQCRPASSTSSRGVYALEDIEPGRVIVFHRCLAHLQANTSGLGKEIFEDEMVEIIANKVAFSPKMGKEIYKLWAGNKLKSLDENDISHNMKVDITRIRKIVARNTSIHLNQLTLEMRCALSTIGAQLSHSCVDANVLGIYFDNHCFKVRASKPIKKGEQLVIQWCYVEKHLETRRRELKKFGISCNCRLCKYHDHLDVSTVQIISKLTAGLQNMDAVDYERNRHQLNSAFDIFDQLDRLYVDAPDLNMLLLGRSVHDLYQALRTIGSLDKVVAICEKVFIAAQTASAIDVAVYSATIIMRCYLQLKMKAKAVEWFEQVEKSASVGGKRVVWSDPAACEMERGLKGKYRF